MAETKQNVQESVIAAALHVAGASGVTVRIDERGTCHLSGTVRDEKQAESVLTMVENAGLEDIQVKWSQVGDVVTVVDQQTHRVQAGETWWDIAVRFYGDGHKREQLRAANGAAISLEAGDVLVIPKLPA
jgi:nucleoid-associated protein YgaU